MRVRTRLLSLGAVATALMLVSTGSAFARGVLPATARPHGWTPERMTRALALFTTSANDLSHYPDTPFQILYADAGTSVPVDGGSDFVGSHKAPFTVRPGTGFFVPLWNADDSTPIAGSWPATHADAIPYFFDPTQLGAADFTISVDGRATPIGNEYLAGPVSTPPLPDFVPGGVPGTHIITLGAFLTPLSVGTHTVDISGGLFGRLVSETYGLSFGEEHIRYIVNVQHAGRTEVGTRRT
jgi:hypothetical protein